MRNMRRLVAATAVLAMAFAGGVAINLNAGPGHADSGQGKGYLPGLGDLMNASMQVHHTKLWLAGRSQNWPLAAYELKELRETVDDVQTFAPAWRGVPIGSMVVTLYPGFNALDGAVKARDAAAFNAAFHQLTAACSACHAAASHPEIRIIVPSPDESSKFVDQDFTPAGGPQ